MTPAEIKQARTDAGLTLREAAALVHVDVRTWQRWEAGEREMSPAHWELFHVKQAICKYAAFCHRSRWYA